MFLKTFTETLPLKKPTNPETIPSNMVCDWKILSNSRVLYIIRKVIKCRFEWYLSLKRWLKPLPCETSNMVYVNEKGFDNDDVKYTVEKVLKNAI